MDVRGSGVVFDWENLFVLPSHSALGVTWGSLRHPGSETPRLFGLRISQKSAAFPDSEYRDCGLVLEFQTRNIAEVSQVLEFRTRNIPVGYPRISGLGISGMGISDKLYPVFLNPIRFVRNRTFKTPNIG